MNLQTTIKSLSDKYFSENVEIRRHLHQNPELSFKEFETSKFIESKLAELDIPYKKVATTGIVGFIKGGKSDGRKIAIRADIDALPINEQNNCSFKSTQQGVMHACGHDIHITTLLGTAKILKQLEAELCGEIMLIFQPAEEMIPGGASMMIESGIFNNFVPELIIAQHVMPEMKTGNVGFCPDMYLASVDDIKINIVGKGGHAAQPHSIIDPLLIASHTMVALQQIVSRNANAITPTVLSFGKIDCNGSNNVIPNEITLYGTFRTMNEGWRKRAHEKIKTLSNSIAAGMGGTSTVTIETGYPALYNNRKATENLQKLATDFLGEQNTLSLEPEMISEDFAYFANQYPSVMFRTGICKPENETTFPLHSPFFDADENALKTTVGIMSYLAVATLNK